MSRKKLTQLTDAQHDAMPGFAQKWIEYGWRTESLSESEWATWEAGVRKCYEFADIPWPGIVIRVPSPMVGAFAAPFAAIAISLHRALPKVLSEINSPDSLAVESAVRSAVDSAVRSAVYSAVDSAVGSAVGSAVYSAVDSAVYSAVYSAVRSAVGSAVGSAVESAGIEPFWHYWMGGRLWAYWPAFIAYFRDVVNLQLDGDTWERSRAYEDALSASYWWPNRDFVMVCDTPTILHVEAAAGQHHMHCETGPSVAWADGWGLYSWRGTQVPRDLIETGWDIERIMAEPNTEIRRCAIEKMGWDQFINAAGMKLADEAPDPGNSGQMLRLYDVPENVLDLPIRVLVAHNATRERDGTRHTFGLTTPMDCKTAISAAAWTFNLTENEYKNLARAT